MKVSRQEARLEDRNDGPVRMKNLNYIIIIIMIRIIIMIPGQRAQSKRAGENRPTTSRCIVMNAHNSLTATMNHARSGLGEEADSLLPHRDSDPWRWSQAVLFLSETSPSLNFRALNFQSHSSHESSELSKLRSPFRVLTSDSKVQSLKSRLEFTRFRS